MINSNRLVRVFISSTFRDFIEERDELVKKVFPELRRRCKERFVEVLEVDLRWGITEEQSKSGETLRICLEEIDRCRPSASVFFVGLLGERYGWVPPKDFYREDVLENPNLAWVKEHIAGKSVTELEILHGVLRNHSIGDKSFFYFRNDGYEIEHWEKIKSYHDARLPAIKIEPEDFNNRNAEIGRSIADEKQHKLKQTIRDAGLKWRPFGTPSEMADMVLEDLWASICKEFPVALVPGKNERLRLEHEVFARSRLAGFVPRRGIIDQLDEWISSPSPNICLLTGEGGSGKSSLIVAWLSHLGERAPRRSFVHFIGGTPESSTSQGILFRLLHEIREWGVVKEPVPLDFVEAAAVLPEWLRLAAEGQERGVLLVLDALNQIQGGTLDWLPVEMPEGVRLLASVLTGMKGNFLLKNSILKTITVPPLTMDERRMVIYRSLGEVGKSPEALPVEKLVAAKQSANPLYLRVALNELKTRGSFGKVEELLDQLLQAKNPAELFVLVLKSLEEFDRERPNLVRESLGYLGLARRGLTESELLELLSSDSKPVSSPLPRHYWSPLYLALEESLVNRNGRLSFFHDYLRQAVESEYLDEDCERQKIHERLGELALAWSSNSFSPALHEYGLEHGILHLVSCGKSPEALGLLFDEDFCQAQKKLDPSLNAHLEALEICILELCKDSAFEFVPSDKSLVRLVEMESAVLKSRISAALESLLLLRNPDCPDHQIVMTASICGSLKRSMAVGSVLIGVEAISQSGSRNQIAKGRIERWLSLADEKIGDLNLSNSFPPEQLRFFIENKRNLISPETALRFGIPGLILVEMLLEDDQGDTAYQLLQSPYLTESKRDFVNLFANSGHWDFAFKLALNEEAGSALDEESGNSFDCIRAWDYLVLSCAKASQLELAREATSKFLGYVEEEIQKDDWGIANTVYYRSRAAAWLLVCDQKQEAQKQLDLAFHALPEEASSTLEIRILRALADAASFSEEVNSFQLSSIKQIIRRHGGNADPVVVECLKTLGIVDVAEDLVEQCIKNFTTKPSCADACLSCMEILGRFHDLSKSPLLDEWVAYALQLAENKARAPLDERDSIQRTSRDMLFLVSLGDCLLKMARIDELAGVIAILQKTIDHNNPEYYRAFLYKDVARRDLEFLGGWMEVDRKIKEWQGASSPSKIDANQSATDSISIDNGQQTFFDLLQQGDFHSAWDHLLADRLVDLENGTDPFENICDSLLLAIKLCLSGVRDDITVEKVKNSGNQIVNLLKENLLPFKDYEKIIEIQLVAERILQCRSQLSNYLFERNRGTDHPAVEAWRDFNAEDREKSLSEFESEAMAIVELLRGKKVGDFSMLGLMEDIEKAHANLKAAHIAGRIENYHDVDKFLLEFVGIIKNCVSNEGFSDDWESIQQVDEITLNAGLCALFHLPPESISPKQIAQFLRDKNETPHKILSLWLMEEYQTACQLIERDTDAADFVGHLFESANTFYQSKCLIRSMFLNKEVRHWNPSFFIQILSDYTEKPF